MLRMYYRLEGKTQMLLRQRRRYQSLEEALDMEFQGIPAWILFWEQYRVDFAWFDGSVVQWQDENPAKLEYLLEIRIFSPKKELYLRKKEAEMLDGRVLTISDAGSMSDDLISDQVLWEKKELPHMWGSLLKNGCLTEEHGMCYHLSSVTDTKSIDVGYEVVSYYKPDERDGMLRLLDYRMSRIYQEINGEKYFLEGGK